METNAGALVLLVATLVASAALAGAAITVRSDSEVAVHVRAPPAAFDAGPGAAKGRHVEDFTLSGNRTSFSLVVRAKPGADTTVKEVARLTSGSDQPRTVTFRAVQVPQGHVEAFTWTVRDGGVAVAVLDHKAGSPSATFTLPARASYALDLRVDLADGAGRHNAAVSSALRMEVRA